MDHIKFLSYFTMDWDTSDDAVDVPPDEAWYAGFDNTVQQIMWIEQEDGSISVSNAIQIHDCYQQDYETMTLLIPDRDRENQTDFIWCVPVERVKWNRWYELSKKFKTAVPPEHGGVRYVNRMEGKKVRTILMMPNEEQSDDDAVTSCAYLRMVKEMTCRMYIVRSTDDPLTGARLINKVAGCDASLVEDMEIQEDEGKEEADV